MSQHPYKYFKNLNNIKKEEIKYYFERQNLELSDSFINSIEKHKEIDFMTFCKNLLHNHKEYQLIKNKINEINELAKRINIFKQNKNTTKVNIEVENLMRSYLLEELEFVKNNFKNILKISNTEEINNNNNNNDFNYKNNYSEEYINESEYSIKNQAANIDNKSDISEQIIETDNKDIPKPWKLSTMLLSMCINMYNSRIINNDERRKFKILIIKNENTFADIIREYENNGNSSLWYSKVKEIWNKQ